jgi:hypothetical protein
MPQSFRKFTPEQDGRRKILKEEYQHIRHLYSNLHSLRKVAKIYGVDKRTIQFILYPNRLKHLQEMHRKNEHWKTYFNRKQLTEAVKKLRAKKRKLGLAFNPNKSN